MTNQNIAHVYENKTADLTLGRISIDPIPGYTIRKSNSVFLATNRNHVCGAASCTFQLATNENNVREGWILHQHNLIEWIPPVAHRLIHTAKDMYCVQVKGDCGADVPIYRHVGITKDGFHYLYTIGETDYIKGYFKEAVPLCYGWNTTRFASDPSIKKDDQCGSISSDDLDPLNVFDNGRNGAFRDHYYTTRIPTRTELEDPISEFSGYTLLDDLGLVARNRSSCKCLQKMKQLVDNQTGVLGRLDHKFVTEGKEVKRPFEKYKPTGEVFYCATKMNACGATIPVRKYFNYASIDTIYTVNTDVIPDFSSAFPEGVLCYIWDPSYIDPDESAMMQSITKERGCSRLPAIKHGFIEYSEEVNKNSDVAAGTTATLHCYAGYKPTLDLELTCLSTGSWYPASSFSDCYKDTLGCQILQNVAHGKIHYSANLNDNNLYPIGVTAELKCEDGYEPKQDEQLLCLGTDAWFPAPKFRGCVARNKDCSPIPKVNNGEITYTSPLVNNSVPSLSLAYLECNRGYTAGAVSQAYCLSNGTWFPKAVLSDCKPRT
ncbi:unnamed protein product [Enterobius vermicularis]|uniref:Sushi domain-containing protein n=1 Tax=Enterobius vermicularis TaxID=51028 RepID=A0A0N4V170_ENTVE|nr:unnamed protein product [Enterobius vermicularis]